MYQEKDFMAFVEMDLFDWKIKEDAPEWAKKDFEEFMKELNNKDTK